MPLITSMTPRPLNEATKEILKSGLARIMENVAGKSESWLMICFHENDTLYFRGAKVEDGAIIDIKLIGSLDSNQKKDLVKQICDLYAKETYCHSENIYVTIEEYEGKNWGWNGSTF